jgi:uncharacterized protein YbjQ (UPF0145 family)
MNVRTNLKDLQDSTFVKSAGGKLASYDKRVKDLTSDALGRLGNVAED